MVSNIFPFFGRIGGSPGRRKVQQDSSTRKAMEDTRAEWAQRKRLKMYGAVVYSLFVIVLYLFFVIL